MSDNVNGGESRVDPTTGTATVRPALKGFGAQLRAAREAKGLSIDDVQRHTRLADRQIRALEEEKMDELPEPVYVRAFLRSICKLLEIDPNPLEDDYNMRYAPTSRPAPHQIPEVAYSREQVFEGSSGTHYGWKAVGLLVVIAVIAAGVWAVMQQKKTADVATDIKSNRSQVVVMQDNKNSEEEEAANSAQLSSDAAVEDKNAAAQSSNQTPGAGTGSSASTQPAAANSAAQTAPTPAPTTTPAPAVPAVQIVADKGPLPSNVRTDAVDLKITTAAGQRSWIRISSLKNNDQTVFEQEIPANTTREVKTNLPLRVVIGNSNGLRIQAAGQDLDLKSVTAQRGRTARFRLQ